MSGGLLINALLRETGAEISSRLVDELQRRHADASFAFTGQGLSWLLDGRYRYLMGLTWPYDSANAQAALANALGLVEQDPNLTPDQSATFEKELSADIEGYATSGT